MAKRNKSRLSLPISRQGSAKYAFDRLNAFVQSKYVRDHSLRFKAELSLHYFQDDGEGSVEFEHSINPDEDRPCFKSFRPRILSLVKLLSSSNGPESLVKANLCVQAPVTYLKSLELDCTDHLAMFESDIVPHYTFNITPRLVRGEHVHAVSLFDGTHKNSLLGLSSNCKISNKDYRVISASFKDWERKTIHPLAKELFG